MCVQYPWRESGGPREGGAVREGGKACGKEGKEVVGVCVCVCVVWWWWWWWGGGGGQLLRCAFLIASQNKN